MHRFFVCKKYNLNYHPCNTKEIRDAETVAAEEKKSETGIICRICHFESSADERLYNPCMCSGSIGYVHQKCLDRWIKCSKHNFCELCQYKYQFGLPYSRINIVRAMMLLFWQILFNYCSFLLRFVPQVVISLFLLPLITAKVVLFLFQEPLLIMNVTNIQTYYYHLYIGYGVCVGIFFISVIFSKLQITIKKCPRLCCVDKYKFRIGNKKKEKTAMHRNFHLKWYERSDICKIMLKLPEEGLNEIVEYFISVLSFFMKFILVFAFMPYLLGKNFFYIGMPYIVQGYLIIYIILCMIFKLSTLNNWHRLRFHAYICKLYAKVGFFLVLQYILIPASCGCAVNYTILWEFNSIKLWKYPKNIIFYIIIGSFFKAYLQEHLHVLSLALQKSFLNIKTDSMLVLARKHFWSQFFKQLRNFCVLNLAAVLIVWLPSFCLNQYTPFDGQALNFFYEFLCVRAIFKLIQKKSEMKTRLWTMYATWVSSYTNPKLNDPEILAERIAEVCILTGFSVVCISVLQLSIILGLGHAVLTGFNSKSVFLTYRYGSIMFYSIKQCLDKSQIMRWWRFLKRRRHKLFLFSYIAIIFVFSCRAQGYWFTDIVLKPLKLVKNHSDISIPLNIAIGIGPTIFMFIIMNYNLNGWLLKEIQSLCVKLLLVFLLSIAPSLLFTLFTHFFINYTLTNSSMHALISLLFVGSLIMSRELKNLIWRSKLLFCKQYITERQLKNYVRV